MILKLNNSVLCEECGANVPLNEIKVSFMGAGLSLCDNCISRLGVLIQDKFELEEKQKEAV
jgi:ribosome-binding protein aMBF1 (putative translation factor)